MEQMQTNSLRIADDGNRPLPKRVNLTEANIVTMKCPARKSRVRVYDTKEKGLTLVITAKGAKSFYWYGRAKGLPTPIDYHLGDVERLTLADARMLASQVSAKAAMGIDPRQQRQQAKQQAKVAVTVGALWEAYRDEHVIPNCSPHLLRVDVSQYKLYLSTWASKVIQTIARDDVADLHRTLTVKKGGNIADKTVKLLRRMLTWAKINPNPAAGGAVKFHGDDQRERFLTRDEVTRLIKALDDCDNQTIADAIRFALFTGARKGNVCGARWADVHLDQALWIVPKDQSKSGKSMTINLAPDAVAILRQRKELAEPDAVYVFPGRLHGKPIQELKTTWIEARKAAKIPDVHFHDLRHTLASWMAMSGASLLLIGKQLGHANKQSTARYAHLDVSAAATATSTALASMFAKPAETPGIASKKTKQGKRQ